MNNCTCPHTATREGFIRNGRDKYCPIHGEAIPIAPGMGDPEILDDKVIQEMLTGVRTINRLHVNDTRYDQTVVRVNGKTMYDHMQIVLEELQRRRANEKSRDLDKALGSAETPK